MKKIYPLLAVLLLAAAARAIELSLEENRGERGSVGYVDMQRLFADSPDAQRAKENFEDLIRQAEERVNLRKAELLKLHQELDSTRAERDALSQSMLLAQAVSTAAVAASTGTTAAASTSALAAVMASTAAPAAVAASTAVPVAVARSTAAPAAIAAATTAPVAVAASTAVPLALAMKHKELPLPMPGMTPIDAAAAPGPATASSSTVPSFINSSAIHAIAVSSPTAAHEPLPVITSTGMAAAAALFPLSGQEPAVVRSPAGPTPVQRLLEYDAKIIKIQADIADEESTLMKEHDEADHGLLDVESRKTDQVLARLYRAVSEVSRREGVSVVVDKTTILYGQPAVDLTDKVLKFLRETPQP